jgi:Histone deacetylation protein Rxt3
VPATLAALPRSAASPGRPAIQNNRNYEPSGAGMRMSVSAILSKSGKEEMYRSKPTVDDQGSRGQSLPPIGQTPNPPSPYSTFHARSSSQPLIENPNQPPRKLSQPTHDKESTSMDTKNRLVQGLLAAAPSSEQLPPTTTNDSKPDAASNSHGSTAPATTTLSRDMPTTTPSTGQMFSPTDPTPRRASIGNLMSAHFPLRQQPHRRGSLDSEVPRNKTISEREPLQEDEEDDVPLRIPKLIIKNDLVWKSLEGKAEKSLGVFVYEPGVQLPVLEGQENATLEVRIPCWFLTYDNKMVKKRALWGTDIYTDDTDIVASKDTTPLGHPSFSTV